MWGDPPHSRHSRLRPQLHLPPPRSPICRSRSHACGGRGWIIRLLGGAYGRGRLCWGGALGKSRSLDVSRRASPKPSTKHRRPTRTPTLLFDVYPVGTREPPALSLSRNRRLCPQLQPPAAAARSPTDPFASLSPRRGPVDWHQRHTGHSRWRESTGREEERKRRRERVGERARYVGQHK